MKNILTLSILLVAFACSAEETTEQSQGTSDTESVDTPSVDFQDALAQVKDVLSRPSINKDKNEVEVIAIYSTNPHVLPSRVLHKTEHERFYVAKIGFNDDPKSDLMIITIRKQRR